LTGEQHVAEHEQPLPGGQQPPGAAAGRPVSADPGRDRQRRRGADGDQQHGAGRHGQREDDACRERPGAEVGAPGQRAHGFKVGALGRRFERSPRRLFVRAENGRLPAR
jgi:hypothetical protein